MFLVTAATDFEMEAFLRFCGPKDCASLVTGVGPVETAVRLTAFLAGTSLPLTGVVNFGVAGAYIIDGRDDNAAVLDICLADREILGDLGICSDEEVSRLRGEGFEIADAFDLDAGLLHQAESLLTASSIPYRRGVFATVSCVSGTRKRGEMLARQHQALCENMEGAAAARVCRHFGLPLLELRCISNLVEDRNLQNWHLRKACARCGEVAALVVKGLRHD